MRYTIHEFMFQGFDHFENMKKEFENKIFQKLAKKC